MENRINKKRAQFDFYFSSFQDIFCIPFANSKSTPYSNSRVSSEQKYYGEGFDKRTSEKNMLEDLYDSELEDSMSSSESKNQLPSLKTKKCKKVIGLPYQIEIKKNEKLLKMKKVKTAANWFPGINLQNKHEEVRVSQPIVRPASSNGPNNKNSLKNTPVVAQSASELKNEVPYSTRPSSKKKRVVLKSKLKKSSEEKFETPDVGQDPLSIVKKPEEAETTVKKKTSKTPFERKFSALAKLNEEEAKLEEKRQDKKEKTKPKEKKIKEEKRETFEDERQIKSDKPKKAIPPTVAEIIGKHRIFNLNQLLNCKNSDFKGLMQEYLRRSGLPENTKIFIINGPYEYLRKLLISRGWIENSHSSSQAFDLKWTFTDNEADYKLLKPGQLYNHFPNNRELTTKSGLLKNLRQVTDHGTNIDSFYPRCYDLGDTNQVQEFIKDYQRTCAFNIIKGRVEGKTIKEDILTLALRIADKYLKNHFDQCEEVENDWEFSEDVFKKIVEFHENEPKNSCEEEENKDSTIKCNKSYNELLKVCPQFSMEGSKNIWIIKPGLNARGSGVKCMQGLDNILECGVQLQARVVQKYIESPLLINGNKFDIRQWVLVTSFDPLTVYFYNNCYLRLCQLPFTLDTLEAYVHLANYSLQKNIAKNQEETVWNLGKFCEYLESTGRGWSEVLPKIHLLIIKTLIAVKDSVEQKNECFELYGFDIILDSKLVPWLLEVNLSPACSERTDWLSEMLSSMGGGILDILFSDKKKSPLYTPDLKCRKKLKFSQNKWVYLYRGEETPPAECDIFGFNQLEIVGEKLNVKKERIFDRRLALVNSALLIQKVFRGHVVRKKIIKEKEENLALLIQKILRRKIAFGHKDRQVRLVACIKIQSFFRMLLAVRLGKELRKIKMIRYVQARLKGLYQRKEFKKVKVKKSVILVQKIIRRKISYDLAQKERFIRKSIILIQKNWRNRWKILNNSARLIQKHWKNRLEKLSRCSVIIQKYFRGFRSRKYCRSLRILSQKSNTLKVYLKTLISKSLLHEKVVFRSCKYILKREAQRKVLSLLAYCKKIKSSILIQKHFRRYLVQKKYRPEINESLNLLKATLVIQKHMKAHQTRKSFNKLRKDRSATLIQKIFKGFKARKYFSFLIVINESAKIIQRAYRKFRTKRKFQMSLRIRAQELERKKRMERLKREQEIKALLASERLHTNGSSLRPPSLKAKQQLILESKMSKIKRKGSKKKCKKLDVSGEESKSLPRANTAEGKKMKTMNPRENVIFQLE